MDNTSLLKMMGFARRAHKLSIGTTATIGALKKKQIFLVIVAEDLSDNAYRKIQQNIQNKEVAVYRYGTKADWGRFFNRTELGVLGISDTNFSKPIKKILDNR